ncbi:Pkinase-domain-containing protein [Lentinus brumalis]|uniref:non-specific serine/threonine protein kinase n=1 Tax=Lentinus brumalis TaxID=2498619 RepID=A0A371DS15_9APHY|nr:Pkinase-domain-containing protein [Polyporus brumalis]
MVQMSAILPDFAGFVISRGDFHLRLIEQVGNGAYGVVYVAQDISPQPKGARFYAVKCLLRHPEGSDYARLQQRELTNHALVSDIPNVVKLHAVMEEEFYTFIVLDLCTGGDLFTAIMGTDAFVHNTPAVKRTFLQILDAVEACHAKGVYHRDLKPENILCSHDFKRVFLGDFGLSTRSKRSSNFGCGSSFYMSPECLGVLHEKKPYATAPSDVWALGTILCNLITGRNPWHVASPNEDAGFRIYLRRGPAWLVRHLPISLEAAAILSRIFELDPETRITISELREAVLALQTFYPDAAASSSATAALKTQSTRNVPTHAALAHAARPTSLHEVDITEGWALDPIAPASPLPTNFLAMSSDALTAAATATLAGTISTFVNDDASSDISDGSELDDTWSMSGPPAFGSSPDVSSDNTDGSESESDMPVTPETYATNLASSVPGLALDASPRPSGECDIASASSRLAELRTDEYAGKKRRGSVLRFMESVRRIKLRA